MDGKSYKSTITNVLPIEIQGEFIIDKPILKDKKNETGQEIV